MIIVMLTPEQAKALQSCVYLCAGSDHAKEALKLLNAAIEQHEGRLCPACGAATKPSVKCRPGCRRIRGHTGVCFTDRGFSNREDP